MQRRRNIIKSLKIFFAKLFAKRVKTNVEVFSSDDSRGWEDVDLNQSSLFSARSNGIREIPRSRVKKSL
jgi:hypothetical protein